MDLLLVVIIGLVSVKFEVAQIDKIVFKADSAMLWKSRAKATGLENPLPDDNVKDTNSKGNK